MAPTPPRTLPVTTTRRPARVHSRSSRAGDSSSSGEVEGGHSSQTWRGENGGTAPSSSTPSRTVGITPAALPAPSGEPLELGQEVGVLPPGPRGLLGVGPAHDAVPVDDHVGPIGVQLVLQQGLLFRADLPLEVAHQVHTDLLLRLERPD